MTLIISLTPSIQPRGQEHFYSISQGKPWGILFVRFAYTIPHFKKYSAGYNTAMPFTRNVGKCPHCKKNSFYHTPTMWANVHIVGAFIPRPCRHFHIVGYRQVGNYLHSPTVQTLSIHDIFPHSISIVVIILHAHICTLHTVAHDCSHVGPKPTLLYISKKPIAGYNLNCFYTYVGKSLQLHTHGVGAYRHFMTFAYIILYMYKYTTGVFL